MSAERPDGADAIDSPVVARAKFQPPRVRAEVVRRPDLVERLRESPCRLASISGPAGSGKSTLMASWHDSEDVPVWVSLDESDNDPVMLWWAMIEGVRHVVDDFGDGYRHRLLTLGPSAVDDTITAVANELGERDRPIRLFVDDLHLVDQKDSRRSLRTLVDRLPHGVRAAFASRETSSVPLAKLRVDGELVEVGPADLALTLEEAHVLFSTFGAEVDDEVLAPLIERSEGWPAGVQLAAMAIAGGEDPIAVVDSFHGDDRAIGGYLVAEVLDNLSDDEQQFLVETSILRQMTGDLCDAVTGRTGGAEQLASLEERNAFVVPLDRTGTWYRYHHLFGELLHTELRRRRPGLEPELHARAFEWFRDRADPDPAVYHGLAAGRADEAAEMFCAHWFRLFSTGRIATARALLDRFDERQILAHQPLASAATFISGLVGEPSRARRFLAAAENLDYDGPPPDGATSMKSSVALARSVLALDGIDGALADAEIAHALEPAGSAWHEVAALTIGIARVMRNEAEIAMPYLEEAAASEDEATRAYGLAVLAVACFRRSAVFRAHELAAEACTIVVRAGLTDVMFSATAHGVLALSAFAEGRVDEAREALFVGHGSEQFSDQAMPMDALLAHSLIAEAALDLGEHEIALAHLNRATRITAVVSDVGTLGEQLARLRVRFGQEGTASQSSAETDAPFTERELEVIALLPSGLTTREIGDELFLSRNTIKTYLRRVYRKLGASTRGEAVEIARERDLVAVPV